LPGDVTGIKWAFNAPIMRQSNTRHAESSKSSLFGAFDYRPCEISSRHQKVHAYASSLSPLLISKEFSCLNNKVKMLIAGELRGDANIRFDPQTRRKIHHITPPIGDEFTFAVE